MAKTVALDITEIRSVTDFQRNAKTHLARLKRTKSPMVLTTNGSAAVVVQDAAAYQKMLRRLDKLESELDVIAGINEGIKDFEEGRYVSLDELKRKHVV